jgi:hypothetical protein
VHHRFTKAKSGGCHLEFREAGISPATMRRQTYYALAELHSNSFLKTDFHTYLQELDNKVLKLSLRKLLK